MGSRREWVGLILIFLLVFAVRIFLAARENYFSDDASYSFMRQIEHIKESGSPLFYDELSYGGRNILILPLYYYLLAGISFVFKGEFALRVAVNLFASLLVIAMYLVSEQVVKSPKISLLAAFLSGIMPAYLAATVNSLNSISIILPAVFFIVYFIMRIAHQKDNINYLILLLFIIFLSGSSSILLVLGMIIYLVLCYIEKIQILRSELEIIFFSVFFYLWGNFIFLKKAFEVHGFSLVWQNTPGSLIRDYFSSLDVFRIMGSIGQVTVLLGILAIYLFLFKRKSQGVYMLISLALAGFLPMIFGLIPMNLGSIFLGASLIALSSVALKEGILYARKTKLAPHENLFFILASVVVITATVLPAAGYIARGNSSLLNDEKLRSFAWIKENTGPDSTVLIPYNEGIYMSYFTQRKNVIDTDFLLAPDVDTRFNDTRQIYVTNSEIDAVRLIDRYDIGYILLDENAKALFGIDGLRYSDESCFMLVYSQDNVSILKSLCRLEK